MSGDHRMMSAPENYNLFVKDCLRTHRKAEKSNLYEVKCSHRSIRRLVHG